ncbi:hypothetical protein [Bradyrhizobium sp. dw_411]|uniref:hypothetical protein n=1 Tax=Bradyrhizobium sp. dw_411 TaxID=2720082 RepID=UPI001BD06393|nr:hypothetical protein [Bradyrhizobium sp. dw_411]
MREQFLPAIDALQKDLAELEKKISETKSMINRLCELAGEPPMYADIQTSSAPQTLSSIQADTFYGKVITTASREYLEMRKAAGLGPASPREIYEALKQGGFKFDTKIENNAITGVRNTLRKASAIFHRLPNNEYGLLKWYPRAKDEGAQATGKKKAKKKRGRPRKTSAPSKEAPVAAEEESQTGGVARYRPKATLPTSES